MPPLQPRVPDSSTGYDASRPFFQKVFPQRPNAPNKIPVEPKKPPYGSTITKAMAYANEQAGRSADILAVRAALAVGKTLTLQQARKDREDREKMPPPSVPPKRVIPADAPPPAGRRVAFKPDAADDGGEEVFVPSKFGNRDPARPEIGEDGNFGDQFQDMKQKVPRMEGESRKAYKKRSMRRSEPSTRGRSLFWMRR